MISPGSVVPGGSEQSHPTKPPVQEHVVVLFTLLYLRSPFLQGIDVSTIVFEQSSPKYPVIHVHVHPNPSKLRYPPGAKHVGIFEKSNVLGVGVGVGVGVDVETGTETSHALPAHPFMHVHFHSFPSKLRYPPGDVHKGGFLMFPIEQSEPPHPGLHVHVYVPPIFVSEPPGIAHGGTFTLVSTFGMLHAEPVHPGRHVHDHVVPSKLKAPPGL